jgi:hypothetical protein
MRLSGRWYSLCFIDVGLKNIAVESLNLDRPRGGVMKFAAAVVGVVLGSLLLDVASGAPLLGRDINGQPIDETSPDAAFLYDPVGDRTTLLQKQLITNQFPGCSSGRVYHLCAGFANFNDFGDVASAVGRLPVGGWVFPAIKVSCDPPYPGPSFGAGYVCRPSEVWPYESNFWSITRYDGEASHSRAFNTAAYPDYFANLYKIPMPFRFGDVSTVPAPTTIALLSLGLVFIGATRRKQAKQTLHEYRFA